MQRGKCYNDCSRDRRGRLARIIHRGLAERIR